MPDTFLYLETRERSSGRLREIENNWLVPVAGAGRSRFMIVFIRFFLNGPLAAPAGTKVGSKGFAPSLVRERAAPCLGSDAA
jgi:hypothetical protein